MLQGKPIKYQNTKIIVLLIRFCIIILVELRCVFLLIAVNSSRPTSTFYNSELSGQKKGLLDLADGTGIKQQQQQKLIYGSLGTKYQRDILFSNCLLPLLK